MAKRFGDYEIVERIGVGGMAEVFRAQLSRPGGAKKTVCLKRIHPHLCSDEDFVTMFVQEARTLFTLSHSNIVQAFDVGIVDNQHFLVMECVNGRDLIDIQSLAYKRGTHIPGELAVYVVMEVLEGLVYAHGLRDGKGRSLNLVHRDINPSNVMISEHGEVKILDFGIAKSAVRDFRTRTGIIKGKLGYMSPEQARGEAIDGRTDVFACGVMLHELLTFRKPFTEGGVLDGKLDIRCDDEELAAVLGKALASSADDRYATAREMHRALAKTLSGWGMHPSSLALAEFVSSLFHAEDRGEKPNRLDVFDRFLAAQVPEEPPAESPAQEPVRPAFVLDEPNDTELLDGPEPDEVPPHEADTELIEDAVEEVTAPYSRDDEPGDRARTEPYGASTTARTVPQSRPSELEHIAPSPGGSSSDDDVALVPLEETDGFDANSLRAGRSTPWVVIVAVLLVGVTLGAYSALRSSSAPSQLEDDVAEVSPPETPPPVAPTPAAVADPRLLVGRDAGVVDTPEAGVTAQHPTPRRAASRAMVHRGRTEAGTEAAPRTVAAPEESSTSLSQQEVRSVLRGLRPYVRLCLSRSSEPIATVNVRLRIDGHGVATYLGATPQPPSSVSYCLERVVRQARFRATGAEPTTVTYPFHMPVLDR